GTGPVCPPRTSFGPGADQHTPRVCHVDPQVRRGPAVLQVPTKTWARDGRDHLVESRDVGPRTVRLAAVVRVRGPGHSPGEKPSRKTRGPVRRRDRGSSGNTPDLAPRTDEN